MMYYDVTQYSCNRVRLIRFNTTGQMLAVARGADQKPIRDTPRDICLDPSAFAPYCSLVAPPDVPAGGSGKVYVENARTENNDDEYATLLLYSVDMYCHIVSTCNSRDVLW